MGLLRVTAPASQPVTLAEVKAQLSIEHTDEDTMLNLLIAAATDSLDGPFGDLCGRAIVPQTWDLYRDTFPAVGSMDGWYGCVPPAGTSTAAIQIPLPPLIAVDSVNYVDPDTEMETVLAASNYEVDLAGLPWGWVVPVASGWPSAMSTVNAVRIRFQCGYSTVPDSIKQAIILLVTDFYGKGSAFVDRTQTPNRDAIEGLIRHHALRLV